MRTFLAIAAMGSLAIGFITCQGKVDECYRLENGMWTVGQKLPDEIAANMPEMPTPKKKRLTGGEGSITFSRGACTEVRSLQRKLASSTLFQWIFNSPISIAQSIVSRKLHLEFCILNKYCFSRSAEHIVSRGE